MSGAIDSRPSARLSASAIDTVRARLRDVLRGPDEVPGDGWSSFPVDAAAIFAEVPGLSLCPGSKLCAYVYRSGDERRGVVWVVPEQSDVPVIAAQEGRAHDGPRPPGGALIEGGMEGDGSLASYVWASILIREVDVIAERGTRSLGRSDWRHRRIIDAPPDASWTSLRELPAHFDWTPRAVMDVAGDITVTLVTVGRWHGTTVTLSEHIDWYRSGCYERIGCPLGTRIEIDVDEQGRIASDDPIVPDPRVAVIRASGLSNLRRRLSPLLRGPEPKDEDEDEDDNRPKTEERQRKRYEAELARALRQREEETTENPWRSACDEIRGIRQQIKELPGRAATELAAHRAALATRLRRAQRLRALGADALLDDEARDRRWTRCDIDTAAIFAEVRGLWLSRGWSLWAYVYRAGGNGNGVVWAMPPESASLPPPAPSFSLFKPPRPEGAVPFPKALRGDGSAASYLRASILIREIAEFGALWHGVSWGACHLVGARPEGVRDGGPAADFDWRPRAVMDDGGVTVTFCTRTGLGQESVTEHVDRYRAGSYELTEESSSRALWVGGPGYVF